jgi:DNA-binding transcriptional LysR family regulator
MALGFLPYCLAIFSQARPKLSIHLDGIPSHLVLERVAGGQFELGFAAVAADRPALQLTPIRTRAMVVLPSGHPLAEHQSLTADQLSDERIIMLDRANYLRHTIERALGANLRSASTIETPLSAIACSFVQRGLGVTIVDSFTAISFMGGGVDVRPLSPELDFGFSMVTARQRPISQVAQEFANEVRLLAERFQTQPG